MSDPIKFFVPGKPQPRGSKNSYVPLDRNGQPFRRPNGGVVVSTVDSNQKSGGWMSTVSLFARDVMQGRELITGPVFLRLTFIMPRIGSHYGTGRNAGVLKASAPTYHTTKPDRLKLARGVEDAMTKIVYADDAQICSGPVRKFYGEKPGVLIELVPISTQPLPFKE